MARPITWQDLQGPNLGSALAASQAANEQIGRALSGLASAGTGYMQDTREQATREAISNIMNSADPMAAARAAPQGWQVDPLAIQKAALEQDRVLRSNLASESSLEASRISNETNRAQLEDMTSTRQAASMASPLIDQIIKTGKMPSMNLESSEWKSAAGNKAYDRVLGFWNTYQDDQRAAVAQHMQAKAIQKQEDEQNFLGFAREFGATKEGQSADPATWDRTLTEEAKRRGLSVALVDQALQFAERGAAANRATVTEMESLAPNAGTTFSELNSALNIRAEDLQQQKASAINAYDREKRGQELVAGNVFKGPTVAVPGLLATRLDWKEEDAIEAIDAIKAEYKGLTDWQAADIALATQGKWFEKLAARSDKAKAMAGAYTAFNDIGGSSGLARELQRVSTPFDTELSRLPTLQRQLTGAARGQTAAPEEAVNILKEYRAAEKAMQRAEAAKKKQEVAKAKAVEKALEIPPMPLLY